MSEQIEQKKGVLEKEIAIGGVTLTQKALLARHLAVMLKSGLTITEALNLVETSATGKLKGVLRSVLKSVRAGRSLSSSLGDYQRFFSGLFINATLAGESSGTLEENLENIAKQLEKERELISKIKGAMLYPIVVLVAAFVLAIILSFVILPKITPLFEGLKADLPVTTRVLIWFSHFIEDHGLILFILLIAVIILTVWLVRQRWVRPVTHWLFLKLPIIKKLVIHTNLARFSRTLGTLIKSGLNLDEAVNITAQTMSNYYYGKALSQSGQRISKGIKLSDNLIYFKDIFPALVVKMIKVGEGSGRLEEVLFYLADFYESEVDTSTKTLSTAIEPVLLIFIGLVVGFLALSIITPIYNITGNIGG